MSKETKETKDLEWTNLEGVTRRGRGFLGRLNNNFNSLNNFLGAVDWNELSGLSDKWEKSQVKFDENDAWLEDQIKQLFDANDELVRANEKANISLESLTGNWEDKLAGMESDYITKLEAAQSGWDSTKASLLEQQQAAAAGWEDRVKAWDQQSADWSTAFAQQQLKHETDLATSLDKQEQAYLQEISIKGQQTQDELDAWHEAAAADRQALTEQLEASGITNAKQIEELKESFAQSQEAQRLQDIEERGHLESQLQDFYTEQWSEQQQDLTNKYEVLLGEATSDIEAARLEQAQQFEQMQLDQSAAWKEQAQNIADRERVFDSRLDEIKFDLGIQEGLYAGVSQRIEDQQSFDKAERQALEKQLGILGEISAEERAALGEQFGQQLETQAGQFGQQLETQAGQFGQQLETQAGEAATARSELGEQLSEDWSKELTGVTQQFQNKQALMEAAIKRNTELGIQNAERARVSASYGRQGHPMNQEVQGVRTLNERTPDAKMYGSATGAFNREGLRIKNLNR